MPFESLAARAGENAQDFSSVQAHREVCAIIRPKAPKGRAKDPDAQQG